MKGETVYILAGGKSSRFGSEKARALVDGQPWIARQSREWSQMGFRVVAIAAVADAFRDLGIETIGDLVPHQGPLRGLEAALSHAHRVSPSGRIWLSCCDLWKVEPAWCQRLDQACRAGTLVACFHDKVWQPFPSCCSTQLLESVQRFIAGGGVSLQRLLHSLGEQAERCSLEGLPPIRQANTPQELERLPTTAS